MKKSNKCFSFIIVCCVLLTFACETPNVQRDNDFQISQEYYEKRWPERTKIYHVREMNNQKFLELVKNMNDPERYTKVLYFFWDEYFSPQATDNYGQSALMWACWYDDYPMVNLLLKMKPYKNKNAKITAKHINQISNKGYTALFCAAYRGDYDIMRLLLDKGASLTSQTDIHGENLLHKMAKSGKSGNIKSLLYDVNYGINSPRYRTEWHKMFYEQDKSGFTPLYYAIIKNDSQMVNLFLELENEQKWSSDKGEKIVNIYAKIEKQRAYPLYKAYEVRSYDIFRQLLMDEELDIDIKFPDGNVENDYEHIGERFDLSKMGKSVFEDWKEDSSTYKTLIADKSIFADMFDMRWRWEKVNNRKGKLEVKSSEIEKRRENLVEIIELGTDNGVQLKSSEDVINRLKELKENLFGDLGYIYGKDLLELTVMNEKFKTEDKLKILDWLLTNNYYTPNSADKDILYFCLNGADDWNDWFEIGKELIYRVDKYNRYNGGAYSFNHPGRESYVQLMTNSFIREKISWGKLKSLLEKIAHVYEFDTEKVQQNITCAVLGELSPSFGSRKVFPKYAIELFKFFRKQYDDDIRIGNTPLCSWFFKIGFDEGVDEILNDDQLAKSLNVKSLLDMDKKRFIDLLNESNAIDENRKQKIEEWKEKYNKIFSMESNEKEEAKKDKSKKDKSAKKGPVITENDANNMVKIPKN